MKRLLLNILPILAIACVIIAVLAVFANTTIVLTRAVPEYVQEIWPSVSVRSFTAAKQSFQYPDTLTLHDVEAEWETAEGAVHSVRLDKIVLYEINSLLKQPQRIRVDLWGGDWSAPEFTLKGVKCKAQLVSREGDLLKAEGVFYVRDVLVSGYRLSGLEGRLATDRKQWQFLDMQASAYGGEMKGQALIERQALSPFVLWFEFSGMSADELQAVNADIFSQVRGSIEGAFRFKGDSTRIDFFTVNGSLSPGGRISFPLFRRMTSGSNVLGDPGQWISLSGQSAMITLEHGKAGLQSTRQDAVSLDLELKLKAEDLSIKAVHQIPAANGLLRYLREDVRGTAAQATLP